MENYLHSITALQDLFFQKGIDSIVVGGVAVAAWGEPRVTRDVDLKVQLSRLDAERLIEILSPDYIFLLPNPGEALRKQGMVFIRDVFTTRLDILLADTPYDINAIQRGRVHEIQPGISIRICSPEDLIVYKLISTRLRDYDDAESVIRRQGKTLDDEYMLLWLKEFEKALDDSTLVNEYLSMRRRADIE